MTLVTFTNFAITNIEDEQDTAFEFQGTFADNSTTITSVTIDMYHNGEDYKLVIKPKDAPAYGSIPDTGDHLSSEIYKDLFHHALDCQGNLLFKDFVNAYIDKYSHTFDVKLTRQKLAKSLKGLIFTTIQVLMSNQISKMQSLLTLIHLNAIQLLIMHQLITLIKQHDMGHLTAKLT